MYATVFIFCYRQQKDTVMDRHRTLQMTLVVWKRICGTQLSARGNASSWRTRNL